MALGVGFEPTLVTRQATILDHYTTRAQKTIEPYALIALLGRHEKK